MPGEAKCIMAELFHRSTIVRAIARLV